MDGCSMLRTITSSRGMKSLGGLARAMTGDDQRGGKSVGVSTFGHERRLPTLSVS